MSYAVPYAGGRHRAQRAPEAAAAAAPVVTAVAAVRRKGRLTGIATNVVLVLGVLLFVGLAIGPHVLGYRTATMLTGSMAPGINPGDVVVTMPRAASELQVDDIISYQIPIEDHRVETHRVTEVHRTDGGAVEFRTKGDANDGVDPWTAVVRDTDTVWVTQQVVPHLGSAIRALRSPVIQHGLFWFAFAGVLLLGLSMIWGSSSKSSGLVTAAAAPAVAEPVRDLVHTPLAGRRAARPTTHATHHSRGRFMTKQEQAVAGAVFMALVAISFLVALVYLVHSLT